MTSQALRAHKICGAQRIDHFHTIGVKTKQIKCRSTLHIWCQVCPTTTHTAAISKRKTLRVYNSQIVKCTYEREEDARDEIARFVCLHFTYMYVAYIEQCERAQDRGCYLWCSAHIQSCFDVAELVGTFVIAEVHASVALNSGMGAQWLYSLYTRICEYTQFLCLWIHNIVTAIALHHHPRSDGPATRYTGSTIA